MYVKNLNGLKFCFIMKLNRKLISSGKFLLEKETSVIRVITKVEMVK